MQPARFACRRAASVGEALTWLAEEAIETKILAGGQSLVPLLNMRLARPAVLVDVNPIRELSSIDADDDGVKLGALVRHTDLINSGLVAERAPLLAEAVRHIGHRAIRNLGTLGGSLAHADPAAELPATLAALDGSDVVLSSHQKRTIDAEDLCVGPFLTSLHPTELLCEVHVPDQRGWGWGFAEVGRRPADFPLPALAATLRSDSRVC